MKKNLILLLGIILILGSFILGNTWGRSNNCTCGGSSMVYQPQLFITKIKYILFSVNQPVNSSCSEFGCSLRIFPLFIDLYGLGVALLIVGFMKMKKHS
jgi:hypothetical protein